MRRGVASIGFANKAGKADLLRSAGATAVVESHDAFQALIEAVRTI